MGNDIVDLLSDDAQARYLNQRFMQRVFSAQEQDSINQSGHKDRMLWSIWAAKEAAYKACQKQHKQLLFAHRLFYVDEITLLNLVCRPCESGELLGQLHYNNQRLIVKWQWTAHYVHCIAIMTPMDTPSHHWQQIKFAINTIATAPPTLTMQQLFSAEELQSIHSHESLVTRYYAKKLLYRLGADQTLKIIKNDREPPQLMQQEQLPPDYEASWSHDGEWSAVAIYRFINDLSV